MHIAPTPWIWIETVEAKKAISDRTVTKLK